MTQFAVISHDPWPWGLLFITLHGWCSCSNTFISKFWKKKISIKYFTLHIDLAAKVLYIWFCCSVAQSCLILCNPMDCSMPGFPVLHQVPEFAQTHVLWVNDAIQSSRGPAPWLMAWRGLPCHRAGRGNPNKEYLECTCWVSATRYWGQDTVASEIDKVSPRLHLHDLGRD